MFTETNDSDKLCHTVITHKMPFIIAVIDNSCALPFQQHYSSDAFIEHKFLCASFFKPAAAYMECIVMSQLTEDLQAYSDL